MPKRRLTPLRSFALSAAILAAPAAEAGKEPVLVLFHCDGGAVTEIIAFEVTPDERVLAVTHPEAQLVETPRTVTLVEPDGRVIHIEGEESFMSSRGEVHKLSCSDATGKLGPVARRLSEHRIAEAEAEVETLRASHAEALARIAELEDAAAQREHHEGW